MIRCSLRARRTPWGVLPSHRRSGTTVTRKRAPEGSGELEDGAGMNGSGNTEEQPSGAAGTSTAVKAAALMVGGTGILMFPVSVLVAVAVIIIICGLGVLLLPLVVFFLFIHGGGGDSSVNPNDVVSAIQDDGTKPLDPSSVPADLATVIQDAGALCPQIGPVVIASQIDVESGFDATVVGPEGEQGLSQLDTRIFQQFGKDDDGNGVVSALDAADSVMAQGRYLCALANQVGSFVVEEDPMRDTASLSLAAYDVGIEAVRQADGVPQTNRSQSYVLNVRAQFAKYEGIIPSSPSPSPTVSASTSPTSSNGQ